MRTNINIEDFVKTAGYSSIDELSTSLQGMRDMDIREVDPDDLADLGEIQINNSVSVSERIASLLQQTKNPYCFKYNGMIVKLSFAGKKPLEECLADCFAVS